MSYSYPIPYTEHAYELLAIECINSLFWNYTREDIQALKNKHRDFAYVWENYIANLSGKDAFDMLWECWMTKFDVATKTCIIGYALKKYSSEKQQALESAYEMHKLMQSGRL